MKHIGFTGTQQGMNALQKKLLHEYLENYSSSHEIAFHHGDCVGADYQAHKIASILGCYMIGHPPSSLYKRAHCIFDEIREEKDYLVRNHDIVDECDLLFVAPKSVQEELRSGTWATYRYAVKQGKMIQMLFPV